MRTQDAIQFFGTITRLARALGCSRPAIYQWGDKVPELRAYQIQVITKGKLKVQPKELCK